jgi:hypothetical protein
VKKIYKSALGSVFFHIVLQVQKRGKISLDQVSFLGFNEKKKELKVL